MHIICHITGHKDHKIHFENTTKLLEELIQIN